MIRGTAERFTFELPCSRDEIKALQVTFWQTANDGLMTDNKLPLHKQYTYDALLGGVFDWEDGNNILGVTLTREETLTFSDKLKARAQLLLRTNPRPLEWVGTKEQLITVYPMCQTGDFGDDDTDEDAPQYDEDGFLIIDGQEVAPAEDEEEIYFIYDGGVVTK